jgi:hypothetical protein
VANHAFDDSLRAIVSGTSTPLDVKINRGDESLEFHLPRVRESKLAELSEQKFARLPYFPFGERLVTVPLDESQQEMDAFQEFEARLGRHYHFKLDEGYWVPEATPEGQFRRVERISRSNELDRVAGRAVLLAKYGVGFSVLLLRDPSQVLVELVDPTSPANKAGLLPGDEIIDVNGRSVEGLDQNQLPALILQPDDQPRQITLTVRREGSRTSIKLQTELEKNLGYGFSTFGVWHSDRPSAYSLGLKVVVDPEDSRQVMASEIGYPSTAFRAGLLVGDLITSVNGTPITGLAQPFAWLNPAGPSPIVLDISRLGRRVRLQLTPVTRAQAEADIGRKMTADGPASPRCPEPAIPGS